jgi:hypothetical protein
MGTEQITRRKIMKQQITIGILLFCLMTPAMAYVGPGLGLGAIGTFFGAIFAVFLAIVGLIWYPVKRLFNKKFRSGNNEVSEKPSE